MKTHFLRMSLLVLGISLCSSTYGMAAEPAEASDSAPEAPISKPLHEIFDRWRSRQRSSAKLRTTFRADIDSIGRFSRYQSEWVPADEIALEQNHILTFSDDLLRCEGQQWLYDEHLERLSPYNFEVLPTDFLKELPAKRFDHAWFSSVTRPELVRREPCRFVTVFDGKTRINLWQSPTREYSRGAVLPDPKPDRVDAVYFHAYLQGAFDFDSLLWQPLVLHFRPFHEQFCGIQPTRCTLRDKPAIVGGQECLVVEEQIGPEDSGDTREYWIDPQRDYAIVRYLGRSALHPDVQFDIEHERHTSLGWIPSRWTVMWIPDSQPVQRFVTAVATDSSVDHAVSKDAFAVQFPARTWVTDLRKQANYLTRDDGTERVILPIEIRSGADYRDLESSVPGQASQAAVGRVRSSLVLRYATGGFAGAFCAAIAFGFAKILWRPK